MDPTLITPVVLLALFAIMANRRAARIGPTVWELEGPIPILKRSKTLSSMRGV